MAVTGNAAANAGTLASNNIVNVASLYDWATTPNIAEAFYNKYGEQSARLLMELAGRTFAVKGNYPFQAHENDNRLHKAIKTDGSDGTASQSGGAGNAITFKLSEDDIDENGNYPVQVGQSAWIEQSDGSIPELFVNSVAVNSGDGTTSADVDIELKPFQSVTLDDIPQGSTVILGPSNAAENTGQPDPETSQMFTRSFYPFEAKATAELTSDAMNQEYWFEKQVGGFASYYNKHFLETEGRMNIREDLKFWGGEENDNSLTLTDADSNGASVHSSKGLYHWVDELGGKLDYGPDFSEEYLDEIETYMESYHVTTKNFALMGGSGLGRKLNKTGLEFIKQYSSGTDFVDAMFGGNNEVAAKANIKALQYGDITIAFQPLSILNDQTMFGSYQNNTGILFPLSNVTDPRSGDVFDNIALGYEQKGDSNLKRIVNHHRGMTKSYGTVASEYSSDRWYFRSKLLTFVIGAQQMLLVRDQ